MEHDLFGKPVCTFPDHALPAIPHRPDGRPRPARAETAAVIVTAEKTRPAVIVPAAVVPSSLALPERRRLLPSDHKLERCCWAADDSRAGSRSRANDRWAACERAPRAQWRAAATRELQLIGRMCATSAQHTWSATRMRPAGAGPQSLCRTRAVHVLRQANDQPIRSARVEPPQKTNAKAVTNKIPTPIMAMLSGS